MALEKMNEGRLVEQCKAGNQAAMKIIYKKYAMAMYNVAMRFFNNNMDAEDILQESFISAFKSIHKLEEVNAFGGWLKKIVINKSISQLRKQKCHFEPINDMTEKQSCEIPENIAPDIVNEAVKKLPQNLRVVVNLFVFEDYKHKEIANMLKISESLSKVRYLRARELLKVEIEKMICHEYKS